MRRYVKGIVDHPYLVIISTALITIFFAYQMQNLFMVLDPKRILPQDNPYIQRNDLIEKKFGGSRVVVVGVRVKKGDIYNPATLAKISRITEAVKQIPGILEQNVVSIADRKIKYIKGAEGFLDVQRMIPELPTTQAGADRIKERVLHNKLMLGSLVSKDGTTAAIITDFKGGAAIKGNENWKSGKWTQSEMKDWWKEKKNQKEKGAAWRAENNAGKGFEQSTGAESAEDEDDWARFEEGAATTTAKAAPVQEWYVPDSIIFKHFQAIIKAETDENTEIHIGGLPVALAYLEKDADFMTRVTFPIAAAVILFVLYLSFRSIQGMIIPTITAGMSVTWALGFLALSGIPLDPWTKTLTPILIVAIAAGHSIQILKRYYEELIITGDNKEATINATEKMGMVMITAGLVATCSFASLITFNIKSFQAFGLLTAGGILSALILELTFIPALRSLMKPPNASKLKRYSKETVVDRLLEYFAKITCSSQGRKKIFIFWGISTVITLIGAMNIEVNNSLKNKFFDKVPIVRDDKVLNDKFGGTSTFYILLESEQNDALKQPEVMKAVDRLQRSLEATKGVGRTESYVDYIKSMNKSMHAEDPAYNAVPESSQLANEFLFLYSISGNPADFDRLVDYGYKSGVIWVFLKNDSTELAEKLISNVETFISKNLTPLGVTAGVAGTSVVTVVLNDTMVTGKAWNILQITLITFVIMSIVRRSLLGGLFVVIPLGIAVLINFGLMGWTGITLGIGTAAISAMAVGMGADYEIYLLLRLREEYRATQNIEQAMATTLKGAGKAIIFVAAAISSGCAMLALQGYYIHMEGVLVPLAMITSCLGTLTLLPAMVLTVKPHFILGSK